MNDPISKLFDPAAGPLTPEEETVLCQALGRIQREGDDDEHSQKLQKLIEMTTPIVTSSLDLPVGDDESRNPRN